MKNQKNYKAIHILIPPDLHHDVRFFAFQNNMSKADIVRNALRQYLKKKEKSDASNAK
jgi:hypothetical protein